MGRSKILEETETRNGVKRPKDGTITAIVWRLADKYSLKENIEERKVRAKVVEMATRKGILATTANTYYQAWLKYNAETELEGLD